MVTPQSKYPVSSHPAALYERKSERISMEEFWRFWHENEPYLLRLCTTWMKGDRAEAREALSGAMMRIVDGSTFDQITEIGNLRAWLVRVVKNHCMDLHRQQSRVPLRLEEFDFFSGFADAIAGQEISPETGLLRKEDYQKVLRALESLPPKLHEVMALRAYQDMPFKEIARHLCISPETARKRAELGRSLLNQRLSKDSVEARPPRTAHDAGMRPLTERRAAEDVLLRSPLPEPLASGYAHLREVRLDENRSVEALAFVERRPIRLAQRLEALGRYMERHPGGWRREKEYADLLYVVGRLEEASAHYMAVLDRQPQQFGVAGDLARCMEQLGRREKGRDVLLAALPHLPNDEVIAHFRAWIASLEGDTEMAMAQWEEAIRLSDNADQYMICQVECMLADGQYKRASRLVRPLLDTLDPPNREAWQLGLRCSAMSLSDHTTARRAAKLGRVFPDEPVALAFGLLWQMNSRGWEEKSDKAFSANFKKLNSLLAGTVLRVHLQASRWFRKGKKKRCRKLISELMAEKSDMREALMVAAYWLERLGDPEAASELRARKNELFDSDNSLPSSYLSTLWQNQ